MIVLPNNTSILHNIKDSFYYNGIEISKENFNIQEFAKVCSKINDIKGQLRQEKTLNEIKQTNTIISRAYIAKCNIWLLCKIDKNDIYFGLYDEYKAKMISLTKNIIQNISDENIFSLSYNLNKTAKLISKEEIEKTTIKNTTLLHTFENYIDIIEKSGNSFQHTYELEFINGYKEYILTDEELKQSLIER